MKVDGVFDRAALLAAGLAIGAVVMALSTAADTGQMQPVSQPPDRSSLADLPDRLLSAPVSGPVSPTFVILHRSALHDQVVAVRGFVVRVVGLDGFAAAGASGVTPLPGGHPQPRIFLADSLEPEVDSRLQLMVLLPEGAPAYEVGQRVDVRGRVDGNHLAVVLQVDEG